MFRSRLRFVNNQRPAPASLTCSYPCFMLVQALRQAGIRLIVAPYEADAQLAFLSRTGAVDVVITEDSDCLPYGCKKVSV